MSLYNISGKLRLKFRENFLPGYPTAKDSPCFLDGFEGRTITELDFSRSPIVAGYTSFDYFVDGSLWILDTPGHAVGHLSALMRTAEERYIFVGGDICHFGGSFRPTPYLPMPDKLIPTDIGHLTSGELWCPCLKVYLVPSKSRKRQSDAVLSALQQGGFLVLGPSGGVSQHRIDESLGRQR